MTPELFSDLVKIGIPSLVALAGTASAVAISMSANAHARILERYRHKSALIRDEEARRAEFLKLAALDIAKLNHYLSEYGSILYAKQETLLSEESWTDSEIELEHEASQRLLGAFHSHLQTRAHIVLLADKELCSKHEDYLKIVSYTLECELSSTLEDVNEFNQLIDSGKSAYSSLIKRLSELYFPLQGKVDIA